MILCSLSCELFLKSIILKTQNRNVRGHDIHELYFALREEEQDFLLDAFIEENLKSNSQTTDTDIDAAVDKFNNLLMVDACLFETIRYKHEYSIIIYHEQFIYSLAHNLKVLGENLGLRVII